MRPTRFSGFTHNLHRAESGGRVTLSPTALAVSLFLLALAPRLPGLRLFLTSDERTNLYWAGSQFVEGLLSGDLSLTYWHFYPGVTMSWIETLGLAGSWVLALLSGSQTETLAHFVRRPILDLILAARLPYALLTAVSVAGFYLLARRLSGHWPAFLGALFIASDPFFLAHSRVAHGDAPVAVFMGLSALAFLVYLQALSPYNADRALKLQEVGSGRIRWWLILSAVMGALAALTKAPGQFIVPFVIIVGVGDWLIRSLDLGHPDWRLARRWLVDLGLWGSVAVFVFVALWPAVWVNPVGTLVRMFQETFGKVEEGHLVFFMGQPTLDPGPWFYPYVVPFRLTPIALLGVLASGMITVVRLGTLIWGGDDKRPLPGRQVAVVLLWVFVLGLLLVGNISPKKQDRYLLPLFPILDLLAAFGLLEISSFASQRVKEWLNPGHAIRNVQYGICIVLPFALLIGHALPVLTAYPYYLAYFNPMMGGLSRAVQTTLVGWGEGMEQAAAYLNQRPESEHLTVAAVPAQTLLPYFQGTGENFYTNDVGLRADYVVLYVSQVQRLAPSPDIVHYFQAMIPEYTVYVRGLPYAWIYPGPKLITTDVPSNAALANVGVGDQLRLAGYQVLKPESPGSEMAIALFWHALAPIKKNYTVSVRLVAPDGTWFAQHDSWPANGLLPTSQWRPGDYVRDMHALTLSDNAAPGEYDLEVVVYDATTGAALNEPLTVATLTLGETS